MIKKLKVGVLVIVLLGIGALLLFQQQRIKRLAVENADLRGQLAQAAALRENNEHLSEQLKAAVETSQADRTELMRLRGQGVRLRQLEQENAQLTVQRQQLDHQVQQARASVVSSEQGQVTAVSEERVTAASPRLDTTDLGSLELQGGIAVHFDLGGGTNCVVTPTALSDGNNMMEIKIGVTNADGTISELGTSRITARPGQHCSISVGDRMIALAVKLKGE